MDRPSFLGAYSTRDVATLLGLSVSQIRSYARAGFVAPQTGPRGELLFSFQDLILLRTAKALLAARIPRRRIHIALKNLHGQLPQGRALTGVRISAQGQQVVARDGGEAWHPESGQTLLDFEVSELAREATRLAHHPALSTAAGEGAGPEGSPPGLAGSPGPPSLAIFSDLLEVAARSAEPLRPGVLRGPGLHGPAARPPAPAEAEPATLGATVATREVRDEAADSWYEQAMRLEEEGAAEDALAAYRRALELAPDLADARLDLGHLLHRRGELAEAEEHYRQALALRPGEATASFNLGVALQDLGRLQEAADAYQAALAAEPRLADAHYNLAAVYEALGRRAEAFRHLRTYRNLTGG